MPRTPRITVALVSTLIIAFSVVLLREEVRLLLDTVARSSLAFSLAYKSTLIFDTRHRLF